jgi:hypothetical protein
MRREALKLMERYMSAIYNLTTVNHDHLFASILHAMRSKKIDALDLRRRVFLAATHIPQKTEINLHRSLQEDQVHLLTDDRYHKAKDFMAVALDTGILKDRDNALVKDPSKFSSPYDFPFEIFFAL